MLPLEIHQITCLSDNFAVLVHDPQSRQTASIDAPDAEAIGAALKEKKWHLSHILVTHHHADHTQGIAPLKRVFDCTVIGPRAEAARIAGLDREVAEGDEVAIGEHTGRVIETPGHTLGHISYYFPASGVGFVGDTLFALGCGRLFEGTAAMMWESLGKLAALPEDTQVYCGHEYTRSNARFALTIEPHNEALAARASAIEALRAARKPTLPTTIGLERRTNPFLRAGEDGIKRALGLEGADETRVFAEIRRRKDNA